MPRIPLKWIGLFCSRINISSLPASEVTLILFITDLAQTQAHSTIRTYLSGICHLHILFGFVNPLATTPRLDLVLKGIQRIKPQQSQPRLPITPAILLKIQSGLSKIVLADFNKTLLWAACQSAFFAFLCCSEFTTPSLRAYQPNKHLSVGDVTVDSQINPTIMSTRIKSSKKDQFGQGASLFIGRGQATLCPISAMLQYLALWLSTPGPLFIFQDNKVLTKESFIYFVHWVLSMEEIYSQYYKGHSFRIGAATTAAACGFSEPLIKTLGRWSSSPYQLFIRTPPNELAKVAAGLSMQTDV